MKQGVSEAEFPFLAHLLLCHAGFYCFSHAEFYCFLVTQISQMTQIFSVPSSFTALAHGRKAKNLRHLRNLRDLYYQRALYNLRA